MKYRVKEWDTYQHYKDRNPPWIKLHFALLTSRTWVTLDDASRVLAVAIMLLASRTDGEVDASEAGLAYLQRLAYLNSPPDLKPLIDNGFLVPLADASNLHANARPETETETETEEETEERQSADRASKPHRGRVIYHPATATDEELVAPTEPQIVMLTDRANAAGVDLREYCKHQGIQLAAVNVTKILHQLDDMIAANRKRQTFTEQKLEKTDQSIADVMERISHGNN